MSEWCGPRHTMTRKELPPFQTSQQKALSKVKILSVLLQNDCFLFSYLNLTCQTWKSDLKSFFPDENQTTASSLTEDTTKLYSGAESDLVASLTGCLPKDEQTPIFVMIQLSAEPMAPKVDAISADGVAVVNMLTLLHK